MNKKSKPFCFSQTSKSFPYCLGQLSRAKKIKSKCLVCPYKTYISKEAREKLLKNKKR